MYYKKNQLTGHNAAIYALVPGTDARHFLTGAGEGWVADWDLENPDNGRLLAKVEDQIFSVCLLRSGQKLVVGNMQGGIHWIDLDRPDRTRNLTHHKQGVYSIVEAGDKVLSAGGEGILTSWSGENGQAIESYHLSSRALRCIDYSPVRNELAIGSSDHAIYLLDASSLDLIQRIEKAHANSVFSVRYSPDGKYLLSGGRDAHLNVWDLEAGFEKEVSHPAHWYTINDIAFHPKGHVFATASRDKTIKIWDAQQFQLKKVLEGGRDGGHFHSVNRLLWMDGGRLLLSAGDDRTIIIWSESEP